jgi:hypothetical protein
MAETNYYTLEQLLNLLPDNNNHEISPLDVRNNISSLWNLMGISRTRLDENESYRYIGVHDASIRNKMLFGKKTLNDNEVLLPSNLSDNIDIFFYNNKSDGNVNQNLIIRFLAGNNFALFPSAPTLSAIHDTVNNKIDLSFDNTNGNIHLNGDYVFLNGIRFPNTIGTTDDILVVKGTSPNLYLDWENISNVAVNAALNYTTPYSIPKTLGGIKNGTTYSNTDIKDVITDLLFKYPPEGTLSAPLYLYEYETTKIISLSYIVTKLYQSSTVQYRILPSILSTQTLSGNSVSGNSNAQLSLGVNNYKLVVEDNLSNIIEKEITVTTVLPLFVGLYNSGTVNQSYVQTALGQLNKYVQLKNDFPLNSYLVNGTTKVIIIAYPVGYGDLSEISISNINHIGAFTKYTFSLNSPTAIWASQNYNVYVYNLPATNFVNVKIKLSF